MSGVVSAGLSTTVLPVAKAGAIFQAAISNGKFQGIICPTTPIDLTFFLLYWSELKIPRRLFATLVRANFVKPVISWEIASSLDKKQDFLYELKTIIDNLIEKDFKIVLVGDLNVHSIKLSGSTKDSKNAELLEEII